MKILKQTVQEISNDFVVLEEILDDADYVVSVYARSFKCVDGPEFFNLQNLRDVFSENATQINGSITSLSWDDAYAKMSKYLSYATYLHGKNKDDASSLKIVSADELKKRLTICISTLTKHITIPPQQIFEHIPNRPSYFGNFLIWGLCLIFLSQTDGIVIYFETSD